MSSQFLIQFKAGHFYYKAEVKVFSIERTAVYDVYYSLTDEVYPVEIIHIYRGGGPRNRTYWRQWVGEAQTFLVAQEFVEIIGKAIDQQEDFECKC